MAKAPTLTTVTSGYYSTTALNDNFSAIVNAFNNTVSRDGSTPNPMNSDLDMNSQDITNAGDVYSTRLYLRGQQVVPTTALPDWKGGWVTATAYVVNDIVREDGNVYICLEDHTSGTFSTDLSATKWELFASKGSAGAGTGDMLAANNLSDVASADTALTNLGGGTTGIAVFKGASAAAIRTTLDVEQADAEILKADTDDTLTAGYTATSVNDGTKSSGTYTPDTTGGNLRRIVNGGAFTLAAPTASGDYTMIIQMTNNSSAGTITVSGFTKQTGDSLTTTDGHDFFLYITKLNGFTNLTVQALQ